MENSSECWLQSTKSYALRMILISLNSVCVDIHSQVLLILLLFFFYTMLVLIKYTLQYTKNRCSLYFLINFEEVCLVVSVFGNVIVDILPSINPMCVFHWDDKDEEI